jgi:predicted DNA-binding transcriptional regulator AlpA
MDDKLPEKFLLTISEVMHLLSVSRRTLEDWRAKKTGPPWVKLSEGKGGGIRYPLGDLKKWIGEQQRGA